METDDNSSPVSDTMAQSDMALENRHDNINDHSTYEGLAERTSSVDFSELLRCVGHDDKDMDFASIDTTHSQFLKELGLDSGDIKSSIEKDGQIQGDMTDSAKPSMVTTSLPNQADETISAKDIDTAGRHIDVSNMAKNSTSNDAPEPTVSQIFNIVDGLRLDSHNPPLFTANQETSLEQHQIPFNFGLSSKDDSHGSNSQHQFQPKQIANQLLQPLLPKPLNSNNNPHLNNGRRRSQSMPPGEIGITANSASFVRRRLNGDIVKIGVPITQSPWPEKGSVAPHSVRTPSRQGVLFGRHHPYFKSQSRTGIRPSSGYYGGKTLTESLQNQIRSQQQIGHPIQQSQLQVGEFLDFRFVNQHLHSGVVTAPSSPDPQLKAFHTRSNAEISPDFIYQETPPNSAYKSRKRANSAGSGNKEDNIIKGNTILVDSEPATINEKYQQDGLSQHEQEVFLQPSKAEHTLARNIGIKLGSAWDFAERSITRLEMMAETIRRDAMNIGLDGEIEAARAPQRAFNQTVLTLEQELILLSMSNRLDNHIPLSFDLPKRGGDIRSLNGNGIDMVLTAYEIPYNHEMFVYEKKKLYLQFIGANLTLMHAVLD